MSKNIVEGATRDNKTWRMRIACCVPKATEIQSEYVILTALPLQKWLHECASVLPYTYTACLVVTSCRNATQGD